MATGIPAAEISPGCPDLQLSAVETKFAAPRGPQQRKTWAGGSPGWGWGREPGVGCGAAPPGRRHEVD